MWAVKDEDCFSQSCCFNSPPPPTPLTKYIFNIFVIIFVNEKFCILIRISIKFIPKDPIYNSSLLVRIMAWRWPGDKPLFEPMMVNLLTPICVTRSPWVNSLTCRLGDGLQSLISNSQTHIKDIHLKYLLWNCPQMNDTRLHWRLVNTCSGNGMVPTDNKPSPEQI